MKITRPISAARCGLAEVPSEFLYAKVRGRRARLYEGERLRGLARRTSTEELALELYPRSDVRDQFGLEQRLLTECVAELAFFRSFLDGAEAELYASLLNRYAIEDMKLRLRMLVAGRGEEDAVPPTVELPRWMAGALAGLNGATGVEEFVERIPLRAVADCAAEALPLYAESRATAVLEMAFDKGYWLGVLSAAAGTPSARRTAAMAPVALECDSVRLLAVLRAARVYGLEWGQIEPLLPPGAGWVSAARLRALHADATPAAVHRALPLLERLLPDPAAVADNGRIEDALWRETVRRAEHQYRTAQEGFAVLISYYYLKRAEMRRLLSLTQLVRYGRQPDAIIEHLEL